MNNQEATYVEHATILHGNGHNCAQAVLGAFSDDVGIASSTLFKIAEGFGGGMGNTKGTCGALSGAIMVLSLRSSSGDPEQVTKRSTYALVGDAYERFVEQTGSAVCKDLQGLETGTVLCGCDRCIEVAVAITYDIIRENEEHNHA